LDTRHIVVIPVSQNYDVRKHLGTKFRIYIDHKPDYNQNNSHLANENEPGYAGTIIIEEPFHSYFYQPGGYYTLCANEIKEAVTKIMDLLDNQS